MALEMTESRMKNLAAYYGKIGIEGEEGAQIVVRIMFGDSSAAERAYNNLLDIADGRCIECRRYKPVLIAGMCEECWNR